MSTESLVVVGFTPGEFGRAAVDRGIAEARLRGSRLVVVNATRGDALVDEKYADRATLDGLRERLAESGVEAEVRQSLGADVAEQVLAAVTGPDDLVVVGIRHRSPVGKLLMGSVAQRVILEAECAVLAVKPR